MHATRPKAGDLTQPRNAEAGDGAMGEGGASHGVGDGSTAISVGACHPRLPVRGSWLARGMVCAAAEYPTWPGFWVKKPVQRDIVR